MNAGESNASPQMPHSDPVSGRNDCRQVSQTGSLEILISGALQIRQSAGKSVKNRLAATCSAQWREPAARPDAAGIRKPVLLKTASRVRASSLGALAGLAIASIDAARAVMQRGYRHSSHGRIDYRVCQPDRQAPTLERFETRSCDGSSARSGPA